jgi:hypothetical protein
MTIPLAENGLSSTQEQANQPDLITEEKLACYEKFKEVPILVEGPEMS